jgi:hypothetical protein
VNTERTASVTRLAPSVIFAMQLVGIVLLAATFAFGALYLMYFFGARAGATPLP